MRARRRRERPGAAAARAGALLAALLPAAHTMPARAEDLLVALRLNGQPVSDGEIVEVDGDRVRLPLVLTQQLRLTVPPSLIAASPAGVDLRDLRGVKGHLDRQALTLDLDADPEAFEKTVLQGYVPTRAPDTADRPGLFMNYNLLAQHAIGQNLATGLFDAGAFGAWGVSMADFTAGSGGDTRRLRNYVARDLDDGSGSVLAGDGFLPAGAIGQQFPFGGLQYSSRNYANSDVRQIPVETMLGNAAVPSNIDVYVNDALQSRQVVPAGPFVLENIPVATGDGNIRVVVRDALGQERVVTRSFYVSPYLLPAGSDEFSYQGGMLRRNYGVTNFQYSEPFLSGTRRDGLTSFLTDEWHAELSTRRQVMGNQISLGVGPAGTLRAGGAVSQHDGTAGALGIVGVETALHPLSAGLSSEIATAHFTQLGYDNDRTLRQTIQSRVTYDLARLGALSASLIHLNVTGQPASNTAALSYGVGILASGYLGVSAFDTLGNGATGGTVTFSMPLGNRAAVTAQVTHDQTGWGETAQYVSNVPNDGGWGTRAMVNRLPGMAHGEAGLTYRAAYTEASLDAGADNRSPIGRAQLTGSLGLLSGQPFAARGTDGTFAVVDTDGVGGVRVYADQQPVGVTDDTGHLVVPHLRAGEVNRISINAADVPMDVEIGATEKEVVPHGRTGYVVHFPMARSVATRAVLTTADGTFVPAGSQAKDMRSGHSFVVGHDGIVYLSGLQDGSRFTVNLAHGSCSFAVSPPAIQGDVQPDLGAVSCAS